VAGKAFDGLLLDPFGVGPLAARGHVKQLSSAFGRDRPHRGRAELHVRVAEWDSPEGAIDPRPLFARERASRARRKMETGSLIGTGSSHAARAAHVPRFRDPDACEGDARLLRQSVNDRLQDRVYGAFARDAHRDFLQSFKVHCLIPDTAQRIGREQRGGGDHPARHFPQATIQKGCISWQPFVY
jgi:hypothetical protein